MSATEQVADLGQRLKGFHEPDTSSEFEGWLDPGRYTVLEHRENFPTADSDFARLQVPTLGAGDTWICARWKGERYAEVKAATPQRPPDSLEIGAGETAVPESALTALLPTFHPYTYDLDQPRYPFELPSTRVPQAPPEQINCCTFVEALLVRAWADAHGTFRWDTARHRQMMINEPDDLFSPVTAAVESGMAAAVDDADQIPRPWTVIQGWRPGFRSGHPFLVVAHHPASDRVLTLEANSAFGLDGVGCRTLGNLRDLTDGRPPAGWWERAEAWTWQRICTVYRERRQASLRVTEASWAGL